MIYLGNSFEEFDRCTKGKEVIAFAATDFLKLMCRNYPELKLDKKIKYVVDNDSTKHGIEKYVLNNSKKNIVSIEQLIKEKQEEIVILIASDAFAYEIYQQLENIEQLSNTGFFLLSLMIGKHYSDANPKLFKALIKERENVIEKKIHCFWFSKDVKSELHRKCIDSWKKYCPDYKIIEWNADNYDITKNRYMKQAYEAKNWAYVSDYARLDVLYNEGGIYMDLDVELIRSLDDFLKFNFFIGFGPIREVEAAIFGAKAKNELVREMIEIYRDREFDSQKGVGLLNVQPVYLANLFEEKGYVINGDLQIHQNNILVSRDYFSSINWFTGEPELTKNTYGMHHCAAGWVSSERKIRKQTKLQGNRMLQELFIK